MRMLAGPGVFLFALLGITCCGGGKQPGGPPVAAQGIDRFTPAALASEAPSNFTIGGWGLAPVGRNARVLFHADAGTPFDGGTQATKEVAGLIASPTEIQGSSPVFGSSTFVSIDVQVVLPDGKTFRLPVTTSTSIRPPSVAEAGMFERTPVPGELIAATGHGFGAIDGEVSFVIEALAGTPFGGGDLHTLVVPGRVTAPDVATARMAPEPITTTFDARIDVVFPSGAVAAGPIVSFAPGIFCTSPVTGQETGFGAACAIHGGTAVLGAPAEEAAYVHVRGSGSWTRQATLTPTGGSAGDRFGASVDVDGDTAIVGAPGGGKAYVFVRNGSAWSQQDVLTIAIEPLLFGSDVAVSGDTAVVAQGTLSGAGYVYVRSAGAWSLQDVLSPSDGGGRAFGHAVAIEGQTIAVGAPQDDARGEDAGAVYLFERFGTLWTQSARLLAPDGAAFDALGSDVALASHVLAACAPGDTGAPHPTGAAHLFVRQGTVWTREATLGDALGGVDQLFGISVAVSNTRVAVGAPSDGGGAGVVFLYDRSASAWTWTRSATLHTWWPGANDARHGHAVGLDVDDVIAGSPIVEGLGFACIY